MNRTTLRAGEPVRNLQHFLRHISYYYNTVPAVIPDGIFSTQTREAVIGFQETFSMPVTGVVDFDTWSQIVIVYNDLYELEEESYIPQIFPSHGFTINAGESPVQLNVIHAMLQALTQVFDNLGEFTATGVHNEPSVNLVKTLQVLFDLEPNGTIDKKTFNMIAALYDNQVSTPANRTN